MHCARLKPPSSFAPCLSACFRCSRGSWRCKSLGFHGNLSWPVYSKSHVSVQDKVELQSATISDQTRKKLNIGRGPCRILTVTEGHAREAIAKPEHKNDFKKIFLKKERCLYAQRAIRKLPDGLALQLVAQAAPSPSSAERWFQQLVGALHMRVHRKSFHVYFFTSKLN